MPTSGAMEGTEQPSKQNNHLLVFHVFPPSHRPLRGSFRPSKTLQREEGQPMFGRSVASAAAPVLVFPTTLKLSGRGGAGRVAGSRAGCLWSSLSSLARAEGKSKVFIRGGG